MKKLAWNYCECGCKCYVASGTSFHIFWDLGKKYTLFEGRFRDNSREFSSFDAAKDEAQRRYDARS
jgi:hypothetical protein